MLSLRALYVRGYARICVADTHPPLIFGAIHEKINGGGGSSGGRSGEGGGSSGLGGGSSGWGGGSSGGRSEVSGGSNGVCGGSGNTGGAGADINLYVIQQT
jgi:hypothetical protein